MPAEESEKKGIIYEAFVKLAVLKAMNLDLLWEPDLPGVIANQDFVYPSIKDPSMVFAVTYWGSHEAANKKYWRTVEDRLEVYNAYPNAHFYSILFEKNANSDDALDEQLRYICFGRALSERNCSAIVRLQDYVANDEMIRSFGAGHDSVFSSCKRLYDADSVFRSSIDSLGRDIDSLQACSQQDYPWCISPLMKSREKSLARSGEIVISSIRDTYYKMAIIRLLRFNEEDIRAIIYAVNNRSWDSVSDALKNQLVALKLIKIVGVAKKINVDPVLKSIANIGPDQYISIKNQIGELVRKSDNPFHAYQDHYIDITDGRIRGKRYSFLFSCQSVEELIAAEHGLDTDYSTRAWVLDYFLALKRALTPRGKYGFQKLSNELHIKYTAGGVVSPLPRYASGLRDSITEEEKNRLYQYMYTEIQKFDTSKISDLTIVNDRTITLMKKLNVIEMLIENAIAILQKDGCNVAPLYRVYSPIRTEEITAAAGATDYNFLISKGDKSVLVFVVSAYDSSHKHKELSGRLRLGQVGQEYPSGEVKTIIVYDGTLFNSTPENKLKMLFSAGWDNIYYVDELDQMTQMIKGYFA